MHGSVRLALRPDSVSLSNDQKQPACKNDLKRKSHSLFHAKSKCRIACWNVCTLGSLSEQSEKLVSLLQTMKDRNIELMALSESRWPGSGVTRIQSHTIHHSSTPSTHVDGVAIVLSPFARSCWELAVSVFQVVSERIIYIRIKIHYSFASIFAVYSPPNPINDTSEAKAASENFYTLLQSFIASVSSHDMIIVLGDFNARVSKAALSSVVGPHCTDECNFNGKQLLDLCACNNLLITNTWFRHKAVHQLTWYRDSDCSRPGHLIDYVLVKRRFRTSVLDTHVY